MSQLEMSWKEKVSPKTNDLEAYHSMFEEVEPWSGDVPKGYLVDFMGTRTDARFRAQFGVDPKNVGGNFVQTKFPPIDGDWWFETVNWIAAARAARQRFVMMTLGACYGAQAVGAYRALQMVNPLPCKLVAVEGVPENFEWMQRHFRDNGIDPDEHWLVRMAVNNSNEPVLYPIGATGSGINNCFSTNAASEREHQAKLLIANGKTEHTLRSLLTKNTTGIIQTVGPGDGGTAEIKFVSGITLRDLLNPFDFVDFIEVDIQQSEIVVIPPFMDLLRRKVRRIHIGTHGAEIHNALHGLFVQSGWQIVFSYLPDMVHKSPLGEFLTRDGVLTVRNPAL